MNSSFQKNDIIYIDEDISTNIILKLKPIQYKFLNSDKIFIGFSSNDIKEHDILSVSECEHEDNSLIINYQNLFIHNINTSKKLNKRIDSLESFISSKLNNNIAIASNQINPLDEMNKKFDDMNTKLLEQQNTIIEMQKIIVKLKKLLK